MMTEEELATQADCAYWVAFFADPKHEVWAIGGPEAAMYRYAKHAAHAARQLIVLRDLKHISS